MDIVYQKKITQHHGTGPFWDKRMVSAKFDQVLKEVQRKVNGI